MSEELLSNDKRVEKHLTPPGFEPLTSRFITICTAICPYFCYAATDYILARSFNSEGEQQRSLKNEKRKREKVT